MTVKPVRIKDFPYQVLIPKDQHINAESWCKEKWGERWNVLDNQQGTWCSFWGGFREANGGYRYHFAYEKDATEFILRWS
jgi:hypothetical protein